MRETAKSAWAAAAAATLCLGGSALGVRVGEPLYVKAKNTRVFKAPSSTADALVVLQPPARVTWKGPDATNRQWQRVAVGGREGYVFQSNLAPRPPSMEVVAGQGKVDARAFASSGAAIKAVAPGVVAMAVDDAKVGEYVAQLEALEGLARGVKDAEVATHARQAGLHPVVGGKAQ